MQASARTSLQPGPPPPYRRRLGARYGVGQQTRLKSAIETISKEKQRRGGRSNFNWLSLQSEFLQIHKAINSQPVSIVLPPLNKRGNARFKQGPMTTIRGTVIERGENAPYPIGYPLDCHLMHHEIPLERPNTESTTLGESARLTAASSRSQQWRNRRISSAAVEAGRERVTGIAFLKVRGARFSQPLERPKRPNGKKRQDENPLACKKR